MNHPIPDISIVIPVYNTERFLVRCLDSVIAQTRVTLEVILVDDGSTDSSPRICDDYARRFPHVQAIHTSNAGPATAKNIGFERAAGRYVAFIDSDDALRPQMMDTLVACADRHQADIVCCNFMQIDEEGNSSPTDATGQEWTMDRDEGLRRLLLRDKIYSQCWTKIFRTDMLRQYGVQNTPGLKTDEDFIYNLRAFVHAHTVCVVDEALYVYTHRRSSLSKDYFLTHISQVIDNMTLRLQLVDASIFRDFPHLQAYSACHCLRYYNELIGKISLFPAYYKDARVKGIFRYIRQHAGYLRRYRGVCGLSQWGMYLLLCLPSTAYMYYRRRKAQREHPFMK
jgi:glycosyltransferase involved in cell wall biosynthesis